MDRDTNSNPYVAPDTAGAAAATSTDFAPIIRRWEMLRIYYNGILVSLVLLLTFVVFPRHISVADYWVAIALGGLIANVCFFTGPAIEGYGTYFGLWNRVMTMLLFLAGLGLSTLLALGSIAGF